MADALKSQNAFVALNKHYSVEELKSNLKTNTFITFGMSEKDISKMDELADVINKEWETPKICLDVANGHIERFYKHVCQVREKFPKAVLMAGNVCTPQMTEHLIRAGADIVKIGIGSGSVCTTRLVAGVGFPQFSAILDCKHVAHGKNALICSDGGCKNAADVSKAFGGGADFVMVGGMFAGTEECDGEWVYAETYDKANIIRMDGEVVVQDLLYRKSKKEKVAFRFYGMSSREAQEKYNGGLQKYRASEGKCVEIPCKGPAEEVLLHIMGGVRSGCAYVGAKSLKDYDKCCTFNRVSRTHNTVFGG
jgi:GMP reductase